MIIPFSSFAEDKIETYFNEVSGGLDIVQETSEEFKGNVENELGLFFDTLSFDIGYSFKQVSGNSASLVKDAHTAAQKGIESFGYELPRFSKRFTETFLWCFSTIKSEMRGAVAAANKALLK